MHSIVDTFDAIESRDRKCDVHNFSLIAKIDSERGSSARDGWRRLVKRYFVFRCNVLF